MAVDRVPQVRVVTVAQGQQVQPTVVDQLADVGVLLENRVDSIGWSLDEDVEPEGFVNQVVPIVDGLPRKARLQVSPVALENA